MERLPVHLLSFDQKGEFLSFASGNKFHVVDIKGGRVITSDDLQNQNHTDVVRTVRFDTEGKFLVTAGDDKLVRVWNTQEWKCLSSKKHSKKISTVALATSGASAKVIYSDKFGDVYESNVDNLELSELILGHCSTVTYMILSPQGDHLLTCDRDEKIRVSNYPAAYDIQSYCLGHTRMVSRLVIPKSAPEFLFSGGSDGTLRLWNYSSGQLIETIQLENTGEVKPNVMTMSFSTQTSTLAVVVEGLNSVQLYRLEAGKLEKTGSLAFGSEGGVLLGAEFHPEGSLYAFGRKPEISQYILKDGQYTPAVDVSSTLQTINGLLAEGTKEELEKLMKSLSLESIRKLDSDEFQAKEAAWQEIKKQRKEEAKKEQQKEAENKAQ